jgi:hypothetical protein
LTYYVLDIKELLQAIKSSDEQNTNTEDDAGLLAMKEASAELTKFRTLFESESPDDFVKRYFTDIVQMVGGYCKSREDIITRPKTITSYITPSMPININPFYTSESKEQPSKKKNTKTGSKKPTSKNTKKKQNPKGGNRITRKILINRN